MGHAMCGGIQALLNGAPAEVSDFVGQWVRIAEPARARALTAPVERRQEICEHESVRLSLENLTTFPWIASAVSAGKLELHGCFFDIRSGILERLGGDGAFQAIAD
jgi:carbonic anhydrase